MSTYLLIDTHFLAHRAHHTTGGLSHKEIRTGIIFGIMRETSYLLQKYEPEAVAWCFDSRISKRRDIYPAYKQHRRPQNDDDVLRRSRVNDEIKALRTEYLPSLGFRNIFRKKGYEADDIIASLAMESHFADQTIIVGSDRDLHQLLSNAVRIYNPIKKQEYTFEDFKQEWGCHPATYARCKAAAGCASDNVEGIRGVGEKTAMLWVSGRMPKTHPKYKLIDGNLHIINRNLPLVTLPFDGVGTFEWSRDRVTRKRWRRLAKTLGMMSLLLEAPPPRGLR